MKQINIQSMLKHILTPMGIFSISIFLLALGIILIVTARDADEPTVELTQAGYNSLKGLSKEDLNKLKLLSNKFYSHVQFEKKSKSIFPKDTTFIINRIFSVADFDYEYNLTNASFDSLRAWEVPDAILKKAEPLKGKKLIEEKFMKELEERIGEMDFNDYYLDFYDLNEVEEVMQLTDASFSALSVPAVPESLLVGLTPMVGQKYYETDFYKELNKNVKNEELLNENYDVILRNLVWEDGGGEIQKLTGGALLFLGALSLLIALIFGASSLAVKKRLKVEHYEGLVEESKRVSEKVRPTWDMAKATLEQYFDRNLKQINLIFYVSVFVMLVGFGIIIFAIYISYKGSGGSDSVVTRAVIGTLSGIITEFIGATFLFIYKSTVEQAIRYTSSLERINSVGMSMQILDTIKQTKETEAELTQAKISISKLLLMQTRQAQLEDGEQGTKTHSKKA